MVDFERKVGAKGQVVIPREIRKITGIAPDTEVLVTLEGGGVLIKRHNIKLSEILREQVKKDGKILKKIDSDRDYEEHLEERWKKLKK